MIFKYKYSDLYYAHKIDAPALWSSATGEHFHTVYEIVFFMSGNAEFAVEDKRYTLAPGSLMLVRPGLLHNINLLSDDCYERYVIRFSEYLIPNDLLATVSRLTGCYNVLDTPIPALFSRLDEHIQNIGDDKDVLKMLFRCVLTEIIVYFCRIGGKQNASVDLLKGDMAAVLEYINKNIDKPLCLEDICKEFHYSKSYVCREFSQNMGVAIMAYVRSKKVMYADALLKSGMKPTEVSERCGFSDYSTFYRMYKKLMGKPPSAKKNFRV